MGYLRAWRENLAGPLAVLIIGGLIALSLWLGAIFNSSGAKKADPRRGVVTFVVTGTAPRGVVVHEEEGGTDVVLLASHARLPFRWKVSTADGSPSYELIAQLLGTGRIRCAASIHGVADVKEASGSHGSCAPAVSWGGTRYSAGGWVAG